MTTSFGVRSSLKSAAARRIEAAGRAFEAAERRSTGDPAVPETRNAGKGVNRLAPPAAAPGLPYRAPVAPARSPAVQSSVGKGRCRTIIDEVAAKYRVPVADILSDRRAHALIPPRHEAMFRCVAETKLSLPAIGRIFGRDHSSIGHAVMRHHLRTGDPLPRGMDWKAGRRKRH